MTWLIQYGRTDILKAISLALNQIWVVDWCWVVISTTGPVCSVNYHIIQRPGLFHFLQSADFWLALSHQWDWKIGSREYEVYVGRGIWNWEWGIGSGGIGSKRTKMESRRKEELWTHQRQVLVWVPAYYFFTRMFEPRQYFRMSARTFESILYVVAWTFAWKYRRYPDHS